MDLLCTSLKKKWLKVDERSGEVFIGDVQFDTKKAYLKEATLTSPLELVLVGNDNTCHYFTRDWTTKPMEKIRHQEDEDKVEAMNTCILTILLSLDAPFKVLSGKYRFEGNLGKSGTCEFYVQDEHVICPGGRLLLPFTKIDSIWLERAQPSMVIKSFDVTLIVNNKPMTIGMVSKGLYRHKFIHNESKTEEAQRVRHNHRPRRNTTTTVGDTTKIFTEFPIYITEDDDIQWSALLKEKKDRGLSWAELHREYVGVDDVDQTCVSPASDKWEDGDTSDDGETESDDESSDEDYTSAAELDDLLNDDLLTDDEEKEQDYGDEESEDETDSDDQYSDDNADYDAYEKRTLKTKPKPPAKKRKLVQPERLPTTEGYDGATDGATETTDAAELSDEELFKFLNEIK